MHRNTKHEVFLWYFFAGKKEFLKNLIKVKYRFFENSFFLATITESNDLDYSLRNAPSVNVFKQNVLNFIRLSPNKVF